MSKKKLLGGGNSNIFGNFHPYLPSGFMIQFSLICFFQMAWFKPPTSSPSLLRQGFEVNFHNLQHLLEHSESLSPLDAAKGSCWMQIVTLPKTNIAPKNDGFQ